VSSVTREGIDELVQLLQQRAQHASTKHVDRPFRLPIDRAFIKAGFGSIVTGTAFSGELSIGDEVEIAPQGIRARVRGLQVHQRTVERVYAGQRVAINLAGVEREELERGNVVTEPGYLLPTKRIAVQLHLLHNAPRPLRDGTPIRLHVGTGEWVARILLLSGDQLEPGETAFAEVRINDAIACARFDRFVIRSYSPIHTIGGGIILEPYPLRYRRRSRDYWYSCERKAQQDYTVTALTLLEENAMGLSLQQLCVLLHIRPQHAREIINVLVEDNRAIELGTHFYMSIRTYQQVRDELISAVKAYHTAHPLHRGIDKSMLLARLKGVNDADTFESLLERFETEGVIVVDREVVRLPEHTVELTGHYAEIAKRMERV
ncbi:MAG TPA: hypothetical protein EYP10_04020, partial [Armatimonadetes bacterium]|nr:hypothetical protein [Armatimonadota bacterium]